ncbi:response regulator [Paradevosia shaoguanensis]|uniref:Response regulator transcription factor n=1 Tax=Paradevosia shaoguanensis TaxID=1335043 RepID=A0AA41QLB5_9HYPH|nr:response regulator transcription factor [Paradevosia shaoguanensis]KFL28075.1 LuxR family transcriptional regulator [Devosia sp. 17-2-E-8]QMV03193.1 response regulator [Devosia sp. D6-9]CDP51253.1 Proline sensor-regulator PrlR [Devosia sp. DBB001]MCF1741421.1 response regulator transcription factor [Paradevosia shaoguanensis]MCI0125904.1 response regulator transcription factor [Paradevosia shaoguanensis]
MSPRRIIIVDDHPLFRAALRQTLAGDGSLYSVSEAGDLEGLAATLEADRECDLVLLDLNMPGVRGFSGLLLLRAQYPDVPVMIISAVEDATVVRRAFELGAAGYLQKSVGPAEIRRAIETVLAGGVAAPEGIELSQPDDQSELMRRLASLTPQQVRVLMMLSDGLMNKQIAYELSISEATVKAHVSAILQKLNVDSRTQAVIAASRIEEGQFEALLAGRESA